MAANFKPERYHTLTPFFQVDDALGFIDFVGKVFGAKELERMQMPDGRVMHAEFTIGDSTIMLAQGDTMPTALFVYLEDVDGAYNRAIGAGGQASQPPTDMFWGDRRGGGQRPLGQYVVPGDS